MHDQANIR